jgi:hypothetical protein
MSYMGIDYTISVPLLDRQLKHNSFIKISPQFILDGTFGVVSFNQCM